MGMCVGGSALYRIRWSMQLRAGRGPGYIAQLYICQTGSFPSLVLRDLTLKWVSAENVQHENPSVSPTVLTSKCVQ